MSKLIKDFIVDCVVQSDYNALASLKTQEGDVLACIYMSLSRDLRAAETMLRRDTLDYAYTDAHRKTLIELARVFGTVQVLKGVSNLALPNDKALVEYFLSNGGFTKFSTPDLKSLAISASVCSQTEIVHTIVDWMIENIGKNNIAEDIYQIYECSTDPWIFRKMYETGMLVTVLNATLRGKVRVLPALLDDVDALCDLEKLQVLTKVFRKRPQKI
ncbi:hypothetical protein [Pseudomonas sp. WS 5051]|uniref:hypothetical protein n=1 Tax=Pseudomonas sp. WS 5051 TaxID=2717482 RepID=UPI001475138A|nr:hypothetical protein [Pseudomonas sp. WS 5051]NMY54459.1 hypothetical protein [Pseudomonas sp. WS 5051]